jgi:hypothetical protein
MRRREWIDGVKERARYWPGRCSGKQVKSYIARVAETSAIGPLADRFLPFAVS